MLKIRMQRIGRKNDPAFRIVVTESTRGPKSADFVERIGFYNPKTKDKKIDAERVKHWIGMGVQVSDTLHNMLVKDGIIEGKKKNVLPKKSPIVAPEGAAPAGQSIDAGVDTADKKADIADTVTTEASVADATPEVETSAEPAPEEPKEETQSEKAPDVEQVEEPANAEEALVEEPVTEESREEEKPETVAQEG